MILLLLGLLATGFAVLLSLGNSKRQEFSAKTREITREWERFHVQLDRLDEQIAGMKVRLEETRRSPF